MIRNPKDMKSVKPKKFSDILKVSEEVKVTVPPVVEEEDTTVDETVTTDITEEVVEETAEEVTDEESVEESEVETETEGAEEEEVTED